METKSEQKRGAEPKILLGVSAQRGTEQKRPMGIQNKQSNRVTSKASRSQTQRAANAYQNAPGIKQKSNV